MSCKLQILVLDCGDAPPSPAANYRYRAYCPSFPDISSWGVTPDEAVNGVVAGIKGSLKWKGALGVQERVVDIEL